MISDVETVPGLRYHRDYLSHTEQADLLAIIEGQPWLPGLRRRVQHYGYRYDYTRRVVDGSSYLGPLPDWAQRLARQVTEENQLEQVPDQLIVNEYLPGQGISGHIDCVPCFGDTILSISLGSPCIMLFTHAKTGAQVPVLVEARSLVVMQGEARYGWRHSIPARKADVVGGRRIERGRRVSLTFRTVVGQGEMR